MIDQLQHSLKRLDKVVLSGSWLAILIACSGFALDYILNLALSQWLSPADLGDYSIAVSVAAFGGMFAVLGTDQSVMQYVPGYLKERDFERVKGFLLFSFTLVLSMSAIISVIGFLASYLGFTDWNDHPVMLSFTCLPIVALSLLSSKGLRTFGHILMSAAPISILLPLLVMAGGYFLSVENTVSDWDMVGVFAVSFLFVLSLNMIVLSRHMDKEIRTSLPRFETQRWLNSSLSLMGAAVLFFAMEQVGLYICELYASEEDVAVFAVLVKHARFLLIVFMAVNLTVLPHIRPAYQSKDHHRLQRLFGTSMHVVFWGCLIPMLVFVFKGHDILAAFGAEYERGYQSLLILMAAYFLNFVCGFSVPFLQFCGYRGLVFWSITVALIIEIILFMFFVPQFGFEGAVWSLGITLAGLSLWFMLQCAFRLGLRPFILGRKS